MTTAMTISCFPELRKIFGFNIESISLTNTCLENLNKCYYLGVRKLEKHRTICMKLKGDCVERINWFVEETVSAKRSRTY